MITTKRFIGIVFMLIIFSTITLAQKDVTTFLGIPVDGSKSEMKQKLINKGFKYNNIYERFEGEFNGHDVNIYIATNNNKVYRIMICDANYIEESRIKIRYNILCSQFANNKKYISSNLSDKTYTIPDDEDISYEMLVKKKRYDAIFYQVPNPELLDTLAIKERFNKALLKEYTQEQIANPSEEQQKAMEQIIMKEQNDIAYDLIEKKVVWFTINEYNGEYGITMYYDNEYNRANGEDL